MHWTYLPTPKTNTFTCMLQIIKQVKAKTIGILDILNLADTSI